MERKEYLTDEAPSLLYEIITTVRVDVLEVEFSCTDRGRWCMRCERKKKEKGKWDWNEALFHKTAWSRGRWSLKFPWKWGFHCWTLHMTTIESHALQEILILIILIYSTQTSQRSQGSQSWDNKARLNWFLSWWSWVSLAADSTFSFHYMNWPGHWLVIF